MELPPPQPGKIVRMAVLFEGGLVVLGAGLGWFMSPPPYERMELNAAAILWGVAGTLPMLGVLWLSRRYPLGSLRQLNQLVDELLVPLFRNCTLLELAIISLLAGLGEELLFRGVIQTALANWLGIWIGLAAASLLFGLAHAITPTYAVLAGLIGIYLGWLWNETGNLLVPVIAHGLYDFLALVYLTRQPRQLGPGEEVTADEHG